MNNEAESAARLAYLAAHAECKLNYYSKPADHRRAHFIAFAAAEKVRAAYAVRAEAIVN